MFLVVLVGLVLAAAVVQEGEVVVGILLGFPDRLDLKNTKGGHKTGQIVCCGLAQMSF